MSPPLLEENAIDSPSNSTTTTSEHMMSGSNLTNEPDGTVYHLEELPDNGNVNGNDNDNDNDTSENGNGYHSNMVLDQQDPFVHNNGGSSHVEAKPVTVTPSQSPGAPTTASSTVYISEPVAVPPEPEPEPNTTNTTTTAQQQQQQQSQQQREVDFFRNPTILSRLILNQKFMSAVKRLRNHPHEASTWLCSRIRLLRDETPYGSNQRRNRRDSWPRPSPDDYDCTASSFPPPRSEYALRQLPIHVACNQLVRPLSPPVRKELERLIAHLVVLYPQACAARDHEDRLPLHEAIAYGAPPSTVSVMLLAYPEAIEQCDRYGRLAWDINEERILIQGNEDEEEAFIDQIEELLNVGVEFWQQSQRKSLRRIKLGATTTTTSSSESINSTQVLQKSLEWIDIEIQKIMTQAVEVGVMDEGESNHVEEESEPSQQQQQQPSAQSDHQSDETERLKARCKQLEKLLIDGSKKSSALTGEIRALKIDNQELQHQVNQQKISVEQQLQREQKAKQEVEHLLKEQQQKHELEQQQLELQHQQLEQQRQELQQQQKLHLEQRKELQESLEQQKLQEVERKTVSSRTSDSPANGNETERNGTIHILQDENSDLKKKLSRLQLVLHDMGLNGSGQFYGDVVNGDDYEPDGVSMMSMDPERPTVLTEYLEHKLGSLESENESLALENESYQIQLPQLQRVIRRLQDQQPQLEQQQQQQQNQETEEAPLPPPPPGPPPPLQADSSKEQDHDESSHHARYLEARVIDLQRQLAEARTLKENTSPRINEDNNHNSNNTGVTNGTESTFNSKRSSLEAQLKFVDRRSGHDPKLVSLEPQNRSQSVSKSNRAIPSRVSTSEKTDSSRSVTSWGVLSMSQSPAKLQKRKMPFRLSMPMSPHPLEEKGHTSSGNFNDSLQSFADSADTDNLEELFKSAADFYDGDKPKSSFFDGHKSAADFGAFAPISKTLRPTRKKSRRFSDGGASPAIDVRKKTQDTRNQPARHPDPLVVTARLLAADEELTAIVKAAEEKLQSSIPKHLIGALRKASQHDAANAKHIEDPENAVAKSFIEYRLIDEAEVLYGEKMPVELVAAIRAVSLTRVATHQREMSAMENMKRRLEQELLGALLDQAERELHRPLPYDATVALREAGANFDSLLYEVETDTDLQQNGIHMDFKELDKMFKEAQSLYGMPFDKETLVALRQASFVLQARLEGTDVVGEDPSTPTKVNQPTGDEINSVRVDRRPATATGDNQEEDEASASTMASDEETASLAGSAEQSAYDESVSVAFSTAQSTAEVSLDLDNIFPGLIEKKETGSSRPLQNSAERSLTPAGSRAVDKSTPRRDKRDDPAASRNASNGSKNGSDDDLGAMYMRARERSRSPDNRSGQTKKSSSAGLSGSHVGSSSDLDELYQRARARSRSPDHTQRDGTGDNVSTQPPRGRSPASNERREGGDDPSNMLNRANLARSRSPVSDSRRMEKARIVEALARREQSKNQSSRSRSPPGSRADGARRGRSGSPAHKSRTMATQGEPSAASAKYGDWQPDSEDLAGEKELNEILKEVTRKYDGEISPEIGDALRRSTLDTRYAEFSEEGKPIYLVFPSVPSALNDDRVIDEAGRLYGKPLPREVVFAVRAVASTYETSPSRATGVRLATDAYRNDADESDDDASRGTTEEDEENDDIRSTDMSRAEQSEVSIDIGCVFGHSKPSELEKKLESLKKKKSKTGPKSRGSVGGKNSKGSAKSPVPKRSVPNARKVKKAISGDLDLMAWGAKKGGKAELRATKSDSLGDLAESANNPRRRLKPSKSGESLVTLAKSVGSDDLDMLFKHAVENADVKKFTESANSLMASTDHIPNVGTEALDTIISDTEETYGIVIPPGLVKAFSEAVIGDCDDVPLLSIVKSLHDDVVIEASEQHYGKPIPRDLLAAVRAVSLPPGVSLEKLLSSDDAGSVSVSTGTPSFKSSSKSLVENNKSGNLGTPASHPFVVPETTVGSQYPRDSTEYGRVQLPTDFEKKLKAANESRARQQQQLDISAHSAESWGALSLSVNSPAATRGRKKPEKKQKQQQVVRARKKKKAADEFMNSLADFGTANDDLRELYKKAVNTLESYGPAESKLPGDTNPPGLPIRDQQRGSSPLALEPVLEMSGGSFDGSSGTDLGSAPEVEPVEPESKEEYFIPRPRTMESCIRVSPQEFELDMLLDLVEETQGDKLGYEIDVAIRKASRSTDESLDFIDSIKTQSKKVSFGTHLPLDRLELIYEEAEIFIGRGIPSKVLNALRNASRSLREKPHVNQAKSGKKGSDGPRTTDMSTEGQESPRSELLRARSSSPLSPSGHAQFDSVEGGTESSLRRIASLDSATGVSRSGTSKSSHSHDSLFSAALSGTSDDLGEMYRAAYRESPRINSAPSPPKIASPPAPSFLSPVKKKLPVREVSASLASHLQTGRAVGMELSPMTEASNSMGAGLALLGSIPNLDFTDEDAQENEHSVPELEAMAPDGSGEESTNASDELNAIISETQDELGMELPPELVDALRRTSVNSLMSDNSLAVSEVASLIKQNVQHSAESEGPGTNEVVAAVRRKLSTSERSSSRSIADRLDLEERLNAIAMETEEEYGAPLPPDTLLALRKVAFTYKSRGDETAVSCLHGKELVGTLAAVGDLLGTQLSPKLLSAFARASESIEGLVNETAGAFEGGNASGYFSEVSEDEFSAFLHGGRATKKKITMEAQRLNGAIPKDLIHTRDKDGNHESDLDYSGSTISSFPVGMSASYQFADEQLELTEDARNAFSDNFITEVTEEYGKPLPSEIVLAVRQMSFSSHASFKSDMDSVMSRSEHLFGEDISTELSSALERVSSRTSVASMMSLTYSANSLNFSANSLNYSRQFSALSAATELDNSQNSSAEWTADETLESEAILGPEEPEPPPPPPPPPPTSGTPGSSAQKVAVNRNVGSSLLVGVKKVYTKKIPLELSYVLARSVALRSAMNTNEEMDIILSECEEMSGKRLPADLVVALREASVAIRNPNTASTRSRRSRLIRQSSGSYRSSSRSSGMPSIQEWGNGHNDNDEGDEEPNQGPKEGSKDAPASIYINRIPSHDPSIDSRISAVTGVSKEPSTRSRYSETIEQSSTIDTASVGLVSSLPGMYAGPDSTSPERSTRSRDVNTIASTPPPLPMPSNNTTRSASTIRSTISGSTFNSRNSASTWSTNLSSTQPSKHSSASRSTISENSEPSISLEALKDVPTREARRDNNNSKPPARVSSLEMSSKTALISNQVHVKRAWVPSGVSSELEAQLGKDEDALESSMGDHAPSSDGTSPASAGPREFNFQMDVGDHGVMKKPALSRGWTPPSGPEEFQVQMNAKEQPAMTVEIEPGGGNPFCPMEVNRVLSSATAVTGNTSVKSSQHSLDSFPLESFHEPNSHLPNRPPLEGMESDDLNAIFKEAAQRF